MISGDVIGGTSGIDGGGGEVDCAASVARFDASGAPATATPPLVAASVKASTSHDGQVGLVDVEGGRAEAGGASFIDVSTF